MSDDTIRLVTVGRILRRRWRLLIVFAVAGALVGYGASSLFPPRYTTSTSVLLSGQWEERELLTQAEIATSSVVIDRSAAALRWTGGSGTKLKDHVGAQVTEGNIIKISGTADTPKHAQQLSDEVARQFVTFAAQIANDRADSPSATQSKALRQLVTQTSRRISALADAADPGKHVESVQARTQLEQLRTALGEAVDKLEQAGPAANEGSMVVVGSAARPTGQTPPTRTQLVGGGALLFFLITVIGHLAAARSGRRPRTEPEITAALGSALLGTVDVPGERRAHGPKGRGPLGWTRWLLGVETRWDLPAPRSSGDEASRQIRYRRVGARLREQLPAPRRLLVVVPDGDTIAARAAARIVAEAGGDPSSSSSSRADPMLRVVRVSVSRPVVPDRVTESGILVVLSAGSRTAGELAGIAEACADARHDVVGFVVASAVRAPRMRSAGRPSNNATPATTVGADMTGGSV
ncbi:Wzz/FepE/Etk N-terminal domain-containing protein [Streptomyces sp. NPDC005708]|uniref:Wzz/FepE/Etk N-terminal domain-containing protein n=1 Tax=unclassified Streptomyces TaxID=2593676 RepID=UPI0033DBF4EE